MFTQYLQCKSAYKCVIVSTVHFCAIRWATVLAGTLDAAAVRRRRRASDRGRRLRLCVCVQAELWCWPWQSGSMGKRRCFFSEICIGQGTWDGQNWFAAAILIRINWSEYESRLADERLKFNVERALYTNEWCPMRFEESSRVLFAIKSTALAGATFPFRRGAYLVVSRSKHLYDHKTRLSRFGAGKSTREKEKHRNEDKRNFASKEIVLVPLRLT